MVRILSEYSAAKRSTEMCESRLVSPKDVVEDLFERDDISWRTFNTYKAALIWDLRNHLSQPWCEEAYKRLRELERKRDDGGRVRYPAKKKKKRAIPERDLKDLVEELAGRASKSRKNSWAYRAQYFLLAGLATGVRPTEWLSAKWSDPEKTILQVVTAKRKVGPPAFMREDDFVHMQDGQVILTQVSEKRIESLKPIKGDSSNLTLSSHIDKNVGDPAQENIGVREIPVKSSDQFWVDTHMQLVKKFLESKRDYRLYYNSIRLAIYRACKKLWGGRKQYSLYIMRSQYSANQRASVGTAKTAALLGHSRPDSPSLAYYGKANQAHKAYRNAAQAERGTREQNFSAQKQTTSVSDAMIPIVRPRE